MARRRRGRGNDEETRDFPGTSREAAAVFREGVSAVSYLTRVSRGAPRRSLSRHFCTVLAVVVVPSSSFDRADLAHRGEATLTTTGQAVDPKMAIWTRQFREAVSCRDFPMFMELSAGGKIVKDDSKSSESQVRI